MCRHLTGRKHRGRANGDGRDRMVELKHLEEVDQRVVPSAFGRLNSLLIPLSRRMRR